MSRLLKRRWITTIASGLPRRDRASCEYHAYVPDPLAQRPIRLEKEVAADASEAEVAVARFDAAAVALADTEALARLLLRTESVASSKIEGLEVGSRRLLRAEMASALGEEASDVTATEVLGNIRAMSWALETIRPGDEITVGHVLEIHRRLLTGTHLTDHAGRLRTEQNWIGGSGHNPCSAAFIPPPEDIVPELVEDLCAFCNGDDVPVVVQAAMAHAQFETIHPFVDGNGRVGRVLIQLVLRRRGLATRAVPPISLILATWSDAYVAGLGATRYVGKASSKAAFEGINQWVGLFATACRRAIEDAEAFEQAVRMLQSKWRKRLGTVRVDSAADLLLGALPGAPIVTVSGAAALIGRSFQATNQAIDRLRHSRILRQVNLGKRNRAFEAPELLGMFTDLERQLASPTGNTRTAPPTRRVPRRS